LQALKRKKEERRRFFPFASLRVRMTEKTQNSPIYNFPSAILGNLIISAISHKIAMQ